MAEEKLTGNTAGILMKKSVYDEYISNHGKLELSELLDAAIAEEIMLGYTNPYTSDTALNMLSQMLLAISPDDPFSNEAETKFLELQKHVPPPAYTTAQMRESAKKGFVDVMTMECQAYSNEPSLNDYVFTPFGVRHDNPVYTFAGITPEKSEVLQMFIDFAKNSENQKLATQMGFNNNENYVGVSSLPGADLYNAQALWKKNKSGGMPNVAVFVSDVSGSMGGARIKNLQESLLNSMQYIGGDSEIGLVSFSDNVAIELPIDKFEGVHRGKFQSAVKNLQANGGTHIYSGVTVALDMLREHQKNSGIPCRYMIFVLGDGLNNGGISEKVVSQLIVSYGIPVHTIGYSEEADMNELGRLASYTEGFSVQVDENNVIYNLKNMFNSQM
jgi:Ca-activated chloride channel family protein